MESFEIEIRNFAFGGSAYGVLPSGKGCFVRGAIPGEIVTVKILSDHARFARAELIKVNKPSPERISPACPCAAECQGCSFGHLTYEAELFWKQDIFKHFLRGTGQLDEIVIKPPVPAPERYFWRNKIRLAVEDHTPGYRGEDNESLVPVKKCLLVHQEINTLLENIAYPENGSVEIRFSPANGAFLLTAENRGQLILDTLPGHGDFPVPAGAFFQTNPAVASLLADAVVKEIAETGCSDLTELHCGSGVFSICAAEKIPGLNSCGAEINALSIESARKAAKTRGLSSRCRFFASDASRFYRKQKKCPLLLVDPPRSGLDGDLIKNIVKNPPDTLIYVSCGPDTLQRDIKNLARAGLKAVSAQLFDMFPATAHFESLTVLKKQ